MEVFPITNFTTDTYEMKRDITKFSKKLSKRLNKSSSKFVADMEYGISSSKSSLISNIARSLNENIKLGNTIERICDNLNGLTDNETNIIKNNYLDKMSKLFSEEPIAIFDDSDIAKRYGKKFEDLDMIRDASSLKEEIVPGYHVCEATILTKKEKQPISVYSKIYSCQSKSFKSMNIYTFESIENVRKVLNRKCNMIFDRGYDQNEIINLVDKNEDYFVIRMQDKRNFLFKGKKKNCHEIATSRKGKVSMKIIFQDEEKEAYLSHTKVILPFNKKEYELVIVYGLSEKNPMILLTNRTVKTKEDLIKIVRLYMSRWRVEEYFRSKKQEYDFENMRVRTLKSMNNLNMFLMIHMGYLALLAEKIDTKLLTIKIIERSKSLKNRVCLWITQIARGIVEILKYAQTGIKELQNIEKREKNKQFCLKL